MMCMPPVAFMGSIVVRRRVSRRRALRWTGAFGLRWRGKAGDRSNANDNALVAMTQRRDAMHAKVWTRGDCG